LRKKKPNLKQKRISGDKNPGVPPPVGAPNWCLNEEVLRKFNRLTKNIPIYDDTEDQDGDSESDASDDGSRETEKEKEIKVQNKKREKNQKDQKDQKNNMI
jgi:hypothetical protein